MNFVTWKFVPLSEIYSFFLKIFIWEEFFSFFLPHNDLNIVTLDILILCFTFMRGLLCLVPSVFSVVGFEITMYLVYMQCLEFEDFWFLNLRILWGLFSNFGVVEVLSFFNLDTFFMLASMILTHQLCVELSWIVSIPIKGIMNCVLHRVGIIPNRISIKSPVSMDKGITVPTGWCSYLRCWLILLSHSATASTLNIGGLCRLKYIADESSCISFVNMTKAVLFVAPCQILFYVDAFWGRDIYTFLYHIIAIAPGGELL